MTDAINVCYYHVSWLRSVCNTRLTALNTETDKPYIVMMDMTGLFKKGNGIRWICYRDIHT